MEITYDEKGKGLPFFQIRKSEVIRGSGERGIRTLGTNNSYNGLAICRFSPLSHLSHLKMKIFCVM
ncbi:photosystem II protein K [Iris pallida]|uniref:Photosystem II protein K (Chloroplast) n=1 Tax=Iris pallida TaxID=29817 RepID=A0AAX6FDJ9_IRIPA|nr:photosystem II protein K [Iris pallida]